MGKLIIHQEKITDIEAFIKVCPFLAFDLLDGKLSINAACKMCKACLKKAKNGEVTYIEDTSPVIDKSLWNGICVYVDHEDGEIHPVTYELIGKAIELAKKVGQKVHCLFAGSEIAEKAKGLLHYGVDEVFVYDNPNLKSFQIEPYTAVFEEYIKTAKPSVILVGATPVGRQLAPRVAARFRTGLTADCTVLDILENTDLVQIRPAFGGNIMAQIATPNNRPQLATVRYKVMNAPDRNPATSGKITLCTIDNARLKTNITVIKVAKKEKATSIETADVIVVAGRGVKTKEDLELVKQLAECLGGEVACTRPLAESGFMEARRQIGLSGRTVRPKLIITCGVSGSVQFAAGMKSSERIFAINNDEKAPIFNVAHYGIVGDIYEIVPKLIAQLKNSAEVLS
jgi:Electron transfer flavoprotein, alpha subunit